MRTQIKGQDWVIESLKILLLWFSKAYFKSQTTDIASNVTMGQVWLLVSIN